MQGPSGVVESSLLYKKESKGLPAHVLEKRKKLKEMLIQRFCSQHGSDRLRKALITQEVEQSAALAQGKLSPEALAHLERSVAHACSAAHTGVPPAAKLPITRNDPRSDFAASLDKVADWQAVAQHRADYYLVAQQALAEKKGTRKAELQAALAHQVSQEEQKKRLRARTQQAELKQIEANLAELAAEKREEKAAEKAKIVQEAAVRAEQMKELTVRPPPPGPASLLRPRPSPCPAPPPRESHPSPRRNRRRAVRPWPA